MNTSASMPSNYAIHIVEKVMPVDQLIMILYNNPSPIVYSHFKQVNQHIKNGLVQPGQIVLISPANTGECSIEEQKFLQVAEKVDRTLMQLAASEREILAKRYDFLNNAASYSGLLLGVSNTSWQSHVKQVKAILKNIERSYVTSYNTHGNLNNQAFFQARKMHFISLNNALLRFAQPKLGGNLLPGDIRNNLGLSTKSIVHQWNKQGGPAQSIPNFTANYETVAKMARNLKRVGHLGIALTFTSGLANIQKACTVGNDSTCSKSKYTETGKAFGSIGGGIGGGAVTSWAVCSLAFGVPSAGTSAFWCALVAGAAGGYAGGTLGGMAGNEVGEVLYEVKSTF
ncbi:hypothetical protein [Litoribacillus peritrichatus]|uniref:LysM domain-containing protein n=1 Tax=Litoribacillus peritrichatus TaxID=718191 RepID=A0ABP7M649_9GAMM